MNGQRGSTGFYSQLETYGGMNSILINFVARKLGCWHRNLGLLGIEATKIHLGRHGITALEHALICALNKVDGRLYSAVVINH